MGEIKKCAIGKMINQLNGFAFKSELFNQDGQGTRLCRGINITRGKLRFDDSNEMFWSDDSIDLSKYLLEGGDIVISMDGSLVGRNFAFVKEIDLPLLLVQRVARLRAKSELCQEYLYQWIGSNHFIRYVDSVKTSSGIPHISASQINDFQIFLPPLREQQKIAAILSKWDELIETQTQLITTKEQQKTSLMQKLLTGEVRFPGFEDEWKILPIGKLTKIYDGTHSTPTYTKFGIPFYSVESITQDDFTNTKFISEEVFENENKRVKLERGDILMTRIGDIGTAKMLSWEVKASFYVSLALIKKSEKFNSKYLEQYIGSNLFQSELHKRTIHVAFPKKINLGEISDCLVKLPSMKEQEKIAEILNSCDEEIKSLKTELEALKIQKKGLMQQLLTGKIRVKA